MEKDMTAQLASEFWLVNWRRDAGSELCQVVFDKEDKANQWMNSCVDEFGHKDRSKVVNLATYLETARSESSALDRLGKLWLHFSKLLWCFLSLILAAPFSMGYFSLQGFWLEHLVLPIALVIGYLGYLLNKQLIIKEVHAMLNSSHKRLWEYEADGYEISLRK